MPTILLTKTSNRFNILLEAKQAKNEVLMTSVKKKNGDKPFVSTEAHRQLVKIGICVVTPTASIERVDTVLNSLEFEKAVTDYLKS